MRRIARRFLLAAVLGGTCAVAPAIELRLIGVRTLARPAMFEGMRVGGLSGIDYDAPHDRWLAVSDAKPEQGPARCYAITLDYDETGFTAARVTGVTVLKPATVDLEALRLDPRDGSLWCASEGDATRGVGPSVFRSTRDGRFVATLPLPPLQFRPNRNLESLTFSADGDSLWLGLEAPMQQNGAASTPLVRLTREGRVLEQVGYPIDAWQLTPAPGKLADNGLAELLALPDGRLLALERSGAQDAAGAWRYSARLYETKPDARPAKRLVYDFAHSEHRPLGNLEGLAWGRRLANGSATLVAVSDDNFSDTPGAPGTQFWVFEVLPERAPSTLLNPPCVPTKRVCHLMDDKHL